jgi:hypothetical protein
MNRRSLEAMKKIRIFKSQAYGKWFIEDPRGWHTVTAECRSFAHAVSIVDHVTRLQASFGIGVWHE